MFTLWNYTFARKGEVNKLNFVQSSLSHRPSLVPTSITVASHFQSNLHHVFSWAINNLSCSEHRQFFECFATFAGCWRYTSHCQIFQYQRKVRRSKSLPQRGHTCCQCVYFTSPIRTMSGNLSDRSNKTWNEVPHHQEHQGHAAAL